MPELAARSFKPPSPGLGAWAYARVPRPRPLRADAAARPISGMLVLRKGDNPTFSYYFEARLNALAPLPVHTRCIDRDGLDDIDPDGLFVVVCRYVRRRQLLWLERHRERLAGVALFVDDDIAALLTGSEASWTYRAYLGAMAIVPLPRLNRLLSHVWASTPALRDALCGRSDVPIALLPPAPVYADHMPEPPNGAGRRLTIAFHATDVHRQEHRFLVPVMQEVMARFPEVHFEVLARGDNRRLWLSAGLPEQRLHLLSLMRWPDYCRHSRENGADIFVVPLMANRENAVRADTKRIDCMRLGAAGVFSESAAYGGRRQPGEVHVANRPGDWAAALAELITDPAARQEAAAATQRAVRAMAADPGFPDIGPALPRPAAGRSFRP